MNWIKTIKMLLMGFVFFYFFPNWTNNLITYILKFLFYLLLMYIAYSFINDAINYVVRNWKQAHLRYIDEREHVKGNTLANLTRMDLIGATFRLWHYVRFNKKRILQQMWYAYLENMAITITFIVMVLIVLGFIFYSINFIN
jgi:hypothetical protein